MESEADHLLSFDASEFICLNPTRALSICPGAVSAYLLEVIDKAGCNGDATRCARSLEILILRHALSTSALTSNRASSQCI
jgi:hypothetical protein